jgi:hypothetical protein
MSGRKVLTSLVWHVAWYLMEITAIIIDDTIELNLI